MEDSDRNRNVVLGFVGLMFVTLSLVAFLLVNGNLGFQSAKADSENVESTYKQDSITLGALGNSSGIDFYAGYSKSNPYQVAGYKKMANVKFSGSNLPQNVTARYCINSIADDGSIHEIICQAQNLTDSSSTAWEYSPKQGILLEKGKSYYCSVSLMSDAQQGLTDSEVSGASVSCEFLTKPIVAGEDLWLSLEAQPLSTYSQGEDLLSSASYTAQKDLSIGAAYAAVAGDNSTSKQVVADICSILASKKYCFSNFVSGSASTNYVLDIDKGLKKGDKLDFSCRTESGRNAYCNIYLFASINTKDLPSYNGMSDYVKHANPEASTSYCSANLIYYERSLLLAGLNNEAKQAKCEQVMK
jgi:hypothetical protein